MPTAFSKSQFASNPYLFSIIEESPELFKEYELEEPALFWYSDFLKIAREHQFEKTSEDVAYWCLDGFQDIGAELLDALFCEKNDSILDTIFKSNMKKYFSGRTSEQIKISLNNILIRLNGANCLQLANRAWSVDTIE